MAVLTAPREVTSAGGRRRSHRQWDKPPDDGQAENLLAEAAIRIVRPATEPIDQRTAHDEIAFPEFDRREFLPFLNELVPMFRADVPFVRGNTRVEFVGILFRGQRQCREINPTI